jgi:hypothetical protein
MRTLIAILILSACLTAQPNVWLRSSGPQGVLITNAAWNATYSTYQITTAPAHGYTAGNTVIVHNVCTSGSPAMAANGLRKVGTVIDAYNYTIQTAVGANIANAGSWVACGTAWSGLLNSFALGTQPLGSLDGQTGTRFRQLALSTSTGNVATGLVGPTGGVVVSGQTGSPPVGGTVTVTTTYPHGVAVGAGIGLWNTTSVLLNTDGTFQNSGTPGIPGASYKVLTSSTYSFTVAAPSGVTNGDYTTNPLCGTSGSPYDVINGAANCVVVSQIAYSGVSSIASATYQGPTGVSGGLAGDTCTVLIQSAGASATGTFVLSAPSTIAIGTPMVFTNNGGYGFNGVPTQAQLGTGTGGGGLSCGGYVNISATLATSPDNPWWTGAYTGQQDPIYYRHPLDGGNSSPGEGFWSNYSSQSIQFLVDQANQSLANVVLYTLEYVERGFGVNFSAYLGVSAGGGDGEVDSNWAMGWNFIAGKPLISPAELTTAINKTYNDVDDPTDFTSCSPTRNDITNSQQNVSGIGAATGTFGIGTSGISFQLGTGFPASTSIVNNVIEANISGTLSNGLVVTYSTSTGAGTVSSWDNGSPAAGNTYAVEQSAIISSAAQQSQLLTGTTSTAGTSNTITLNTASSADFTHDEIFLPQPPYNERAFITAYNTTTHVATVSPAWTTTPGSGVYYSISQTATVTGYNSTFSTTFTIGDGLALNNAAIGNGSFSSNIIVNVASNTSMFVINGNGSYGATSTPQIVRWYPKWQAGDCGWSWLGKHAIADFAGNNLMYPPEGGGAFEIGSNQIGGFEAIPRMSTDFALAPYDARAITDLAIYQSYWFDFYYSHYLAYQTGPNHDGNDYGPQDTTTGMSGVESLIFSSVPSYPSMNLTGPHDIAADIYKMFMILPDYQSTGQGVPSPQLIPIGNPTVLNFCPCGNGWSGSNGAQFAPTSATAQFYRNLQERIPTNAFKWGQAGAPYKAFLIMRNLPTIVSTDFTTQPMQYLFQPTDYLLSQSLTGWNYPKNYAGFMAISRDSWSTYNSSATTRAGTITVWQARTSMGSFGYDCYQSGQATIYRVGTLLGSDSQSPGACGGDNTIMGGSIELGGITNNYLYGILPSPWINVYGNGSTVAPMTPPVQWSSANHGSWSQQYGDQNSQYARMVVDETGAYTSAATFNYCLRSWGDLKPTGVLTGAADHFEYQWDSCSTITSQQIATHFHYNQNGETAAQDHEGYLEGHTTCPGSGGCSGLNTGRWIQELESGTNDGYAGDVNPTFGLITNFLSPGNIFVNWDCPGGVECNSGSTYTGGAGHSDRVTVCAGSGSCNGSATLLESFTVHKIASSLTDTSLTTSAINTADGHWFGAQMYGARSCAVVMEVRGGATLGTMSVFTPPASSGVCASNVQYLFGGLAAGSYNVTVGGAAVAGSPFTVAANDNSIEFVGAAGTVSINGGGGTIPGTTTSSRLSGQATVGGNIIIH